MILGNIAILILFLHWLCLAGKFVKFLSRSPVVVSLDVLDFNKKLSYCWGTARRESRPKIAEMDVEMTS